MWNFGGILYRVWAVGGIILLLGLACLLVSKIGREDFNKDCCIAGVFCSVVGIAAMIYFLFCMFFPQVSSIQGTFTQEYRNSRVAPPLPFTYEYTFYDDDGFAGAFYLDTFTRKESIPQGFILNEEYIVYYEARTNVIVGVEMVTP